MRNLGLGLKSYDRPADTHFMNTQSKSQAEVLWEQADSLIRESFQALTAISEESK